MSSNEEANSAFEMYFEEFPEHHDRDGENSLQDHCNEWIQVEEDYIQ